MAKDKTFLSETPTYKAWRGMINRCYTKSNKDYPAIGGMGIKVCDRWLDSFQNFLKDMGEKPGTAILRRRDVKKDFSPDNTYWFEKVNTRTNDMYSIWRGLLSRTGSGVKRKKNSVRYAEKQISVSDDWRQSFSKFCLDMGPRPSPDHSIDRIDNNGDYCKENCRWALPAQQSSNIDSNVWVEYRGERRTVAQWASLLGIPFNTFSKQLEKVFTGTVEPRGQKIHQLDLQDNLIKEFENVSEASSETGLTQAAIRKCLCGHNKTCGGFRWIYVKQ